MISSTAKMLSVALTMALGVLSATPSIAGPLSGPGSTYNGHAPAPAPKPNPGPFIRAMPPVPQQPYVNPTTTFTYRTLHSVEPALEFGARWGRPVANCGWNGAAGAALVGPAGAVVGCGYGLMQR